MSRIGNKPVAIAKGVKVEVAGPVIKVQGPKGNLAYTLPRPISAKVDKDHVVFTRADDTTPSKALHGLARALVNNMIKGCAEGYSIGLEMYGTGYTVKLEGKELLLNCGYMGRGVGKRAQFEIPVPDGLTIKVEVPQSRGNTEPAKFTVAGCDKQLVGQFAAEVRKLRKPEPYLGKGIRYAGEHIRRKQGKVFAGGGGG